MARFLLDTDAVIDYLRGFPGSVALLRDLHQRGDLLCICDVVIAEVYTGLGPRDRTKAEDLLDTCQFLHTSREAAKQAGEWRYFYARQGITLSTADALVAATAHAHAATIVTGNMDDYPMKEASKLPLPR